jgi:hypothetical protein
MQTKFNFGDLEILLVTLYDIDEISYKNIHELLQFTLNQIVNDEADIVYIFDLIFNKLDEKFCFIQPAKIFLLEICIN